MASGTSRKAHVLPKEDKDFVDFPPNFLRELLFQGFLCFFRSPCTHQPPAVRDTVNMGVHTDRRLPEGNAQDEVCRFPSHSWKLEEFFFLVGNPSAVLVKEYLSYLFKPPCLFSVKAYGIDEVGELLLRCPEEVFQTFHRGKETPENSVGGSVLSTVA